MLLCMDQAFALSSTLDISVGCVAMAIPRSQWHPCGSELHGDLTTNCHMRWVHIGKEEQWYRKTQLFDTFGFAAEKPSNQFHINLWPGHLTHES